MIMILSFEGSVDRRAATWFSRERELSVRQHATANSSVLFTGGRVGGVTARGGRGRGGERLAPYAISAEYIRSLPDFALRRHVVLSNHTNRKPVTDAFWTVAAVTKGSGGATADCAYVAAYMRVEQWKKNRKWPRRTTISRVCLDEKFRHVWSRPPMANKQIRLKDPDARMVGEDPRAFTHQGRPWVLPVMHRPLLPPAERTVDHRAKASRDMDQRIWDMSVDPSALVHLRAPSLSSYGKNWVAVSDPAGLFPWPTDEFRLVVALSPLTVLSCHSGTGLCRSVHQQTSNVPGCRASLKGREQSNMCVGSLRCGTNGLVIDADGSFLMVARTTIYEPDAPGAKFGRVGDGLKGEILSHHPQLVLVNGSTFDIHTTPLRSREGLLQTNDPLSMFPCNLGIGRRYGICVSMEQHRMHSIQVVWIMQWPCGLHALWSCSLPLPRSRCCLAPSARREIAKMLTRSSNWC